MKISRITLIFDHGFIKIRWITLILDHGFIKISLVTQILIGINKCNSGLSLLILQPAL